MLNSKIFPFSKNNNYLEKYHIYIPFSTTNVLWHLSYPEFMKAFADL